MGILSREATAIFIFVSFLNTSWLLKERIFSLIYIFFPSGFDNFCVFLFASLGNEACQKGDQLFNPIALRKAKIVYTILAFLSAIGLKPRKFAPPESVPKYPYSI